MSYYLSKRNQFYYFRIRVPKDLISYFPVPVIKKSLKTRDLASAKLLHSHLSNKVQKTFAILRTDTLSSEEINLLVCSLVQSGGKTQHHSSVSSSRKTPKLSIIMKLFVSDREPHWSDRTNKEFTSILDILLWILGDKPVEQFSRPCFIRCRDRLKNLPSNLQKLSSSYSDKDLFSGNHKLPTLNSKTINKYLVVLSSLFKWATKQGYLQTNLAEGLSLPLQQQAHNERKVYDLTDLHRIIESLPREKSSPEKFWIPLIALHSGMRLSEICQLHSDDIHKVDGVLCFDVNADGQKRLKTSSAQRLVPVHPKLIIMGFLGQLGRSDVSRPLWGNLKPNKYGSWGKQFGNCSFSRPHETLWTSF